MECKRKALRQMLSKNRREAISDTPTILFFHKEFKSAFSILKHGETKR